MANNGKWLEDFEPGHAISEVARAAIATRSTRMLECLPLAAKKWKEDVEHVHHLRTWARRTQSALQLFALLLPLKRLTSLRKATQRLRKAACPARDLDVFQKRIRKSKFDFAEGEREEVLAYLQKLRKRAQLSIVDANRWARERDIARECRGLVKRIRWREVAEEETLETIAPTLLEPMMVRFFHYSQLLNESPESLHQMRIEGKKARYAMELVEGGFPPSFRQELYPAFEEVQAKLGVINDHHTAIEKIEGWQAQTSAKKFPPVLLRMVEHEKAQFDRKADAFRVWWTQERAVELKNHFDRFLGGLGMPVAES
ncbi:CHAD domain-containing protein [Bremerella cremea]|uniref:CHAD domain-containing protein n=1 Tax=Bremerella cremea TaxID=1031537 RepID=A0A368KQJ9_9BACT|nr:CHAD domain-containing protein [Bremerella cremea]RCS44710.1 CHAD domain-containing protein [Bremerella cremea]